VAGTIVVIDVVDGLDSLLKVETRDALLARVYWKLWFLSVTEFQFQQDMNNRLCPGTGILKV